MGFFEDILKTAVTDENDRKTLADLSLKFPMLVQAVDEADAKASEWETWKASDWDSIAGKTKGQIAAEQRLAAFEAAGNFGGSDMTFEEIKANLVREGYATRADLARALTDPNDPAFKAVNGAVNHSAFGIESFFRQAGSLPTEYYKEFGDIDPELNNKLLDAYGKEPAGTAVRTVYDKIVAPMREERRVAADAAKEVKHQQELADARAAGAADKAKELGMAAGTPGMPTDQGGTSGTPMGPLQRQQAERFKSAQAAGPSDAPLGAGIIAREGLDFLRDLRTNGGVQ